VLPSEFGRPWPQGVPLQVHVTEQDPWNDLETVEALADQVMDAELCVYPGSGHLFADPHSADYDPELARQLTARTLDFLRRGLSSG
jgi:dienelactone hydrolase